MFYFFFTAVLAIAFLAVAFAPDVEKRGFVLSGILVFWALVTGISSYIQVEAGNVYVAKSFGNVIEETWGEGVHFVPPWYDMTEYTIRRRSIDFTGDQTLSGAAKGGVALTIFDVTYPYSLNPELSWKLYQRIGSNYDDLIINAARSAGRDALANFTWEEVAFKKRAEVTTFLQGRFKELLVRDLQSSKFTESEAERLFTIYAPQIRKVDPPERILQANAENAAAEVDLQRQKKLTQIAKEEAERRANEGLGVKRLFDQLPDATADDINLILGAIANKVRADALMRAVENGSVNVMVLQGQEAAMSADGSPKVTANE